MRHRRRIVGSAQSSAASSAINQDFLGRLTVLASDRSIRILDAKPRIPSLLWCSLIFGGLVLITLTGFLRLTSNRAHLILVSAVAVQLALLLYLVFVLDHPLAHWASPRNHLPTRLRSSTQSTAERDYRRPLAEGLRTLIGERLNQIGDWSWKVRDT